MIEAIACDLSGASLVRLCRYVKNDTLHWVDRLIDNFNLIRYRQSVRIRPAHPNNGVKVITHGDHVGEEDKERILLAMYWTFVPPWIEFPYWTNRSSHVAPIGKLKATPMYQVALWKGKRCAIVMEGFYLKKRNLGYLPDFYYVRLEEGQGDVMLAAGLFSFQTTDDNNVYSCCMITDSPFGRIEEVASEVPLLLTSAEDVELWINYRDFESDEVLKILRERPQANLRFYKIHPYGNRDRIE